MNNKDYFGSYELSQATINSFKEIEKLLGPDVNAADVAWGLINPKVRNLEIAFLGKKLIFETRLWLTLERSEERARASG